MKRFFLIWIGTLILPSALLWGQSRYLIDNSQVDFTSDAPLELIEARSVKMRGVIDARSRRFAFSIPIRSFQGFNNPLQQEHFNENYLESNEYSSATFTGKIIEKINFKKDGEYLIRAKGKLKIHGVSRERIIKSKLRIEGDRIFVESFFLVLLEEHNITIPKIVYQKIAEEIQVKLVAEFTKR